MRSTIITMLSGMLVQLKGHELELKHQDFIGLLF